MRALRVTIFLAGTIALCLYCLSGGMTRRNVEFNGVVSLHFDDARKTAYDHSSLLESFGLKGTYYISVELLTREGFMNIDEAIDLEKRGHEVGSHAVHHKRFTEISTKEIEQEFIQSRTELLKRGLKNIDTFAYPYGEYTDYSFQFSPLSGYRGIRTTDPGMNDKSTDKNILYVYQLENWVTFRHIKRWIDRAVREKKWLILVFHEIDKTEYRYSTSPDDFRLTVEYLARTRVPVMTTRDVIDTYYK